MIQMEFSLLELKLIEAGLDNLSKILTGAALSQLRQKVGSHLKAHAAVNKMQQEYIKELSEQYNEGKKSFHISDTVILPAVQKSINPDSEFYVLRDSEQ